MNIKWKSPFWPRWWSKLGFATEIEEKKTIPMLESDTRCHSHSNITLKSYVTRTEPNMDPQVPFHLPSLLEFSPQRISPYDLPFTFFSLSNLSGGSIFSLTIIAKVVGLVGWIAISLFFTNTFHFISCPLQGWSFPKPFFVFFDQSGDWCYGLKDDVLWG